MLEKIKVCAPCISSQLEKIINKCMSEGVFPDGIKIATVTALHKQGGTDEAANNRRLSQRSSKQC